MQEQKAKRQIKLPNYTVGEERFSWIGHCVGAALSVAALVISIVFSAMATEGRGVKIVSSTVYGATMIILYTMSTIYHALPISKGKKVFRVIDHCSVSLLIAGTYTPYTLVTLRNASNAWGWSIFGVVWAAAVVSIILTAIDLKKYEKINLICYLVMGWSIIIAIVPLTRALATAGLVLLILGGVAYTAGAVVYVLGKKKKQKYMHSVWHLFVMAGSILQFFSILFYVL